MTSMNAGLTVRLTWAERAVLGVFGALVVSLLGGIAAIGYSLHNQVLRQGERQIVLTAAVDDHETRLRELEIK